jgi:hypothetical protein
LRDGHGREKRVRRGPRGQVAALRAGGAAHGASLAGAKSEASGRRGDEYGLTDVISPHVKSPVFEIVAF